MTFFQNIDEFLQPFRAENPILREANGALLSNDQSTDLRISLADSPLTPISILELLANDNNPDVRYAMAENANLPYHILAFLTADENPYVSTRAEKTLERLASLFQPELKCA